MAPGIRKWQGFLDPLGFVGTNRFMYPSPEPGSSAG